LIIRLLDVLFSFLERALAYVKTRALYQSLGKFGAGSRICYPFDIRGNHFVFIGSQVYIGPRVMIGADEGAEIYIEDAVMFGPEVKLIPGDHRYDMPGLEIRDSGRGEGSPIVVKKGAWVGAAAILLKGVTIGEGSIVGAGSVVTTDVPPFEIWAGNPAKFLRKRFQ
jgi:acetyltransferase-like isoleucine patch superfamily enzyme